MRSESPKYHPGHPKRRRLIPRGIGLQNGLFDKFKTTTEIIS